VPMHDIPAPEDLKCLLGRVLLQLCVGQCQAVLNFDGDLSISIECPIRYGDQELMPAKAGVLAELLGGHHSGDSPER
jgi:hypothetical protein